MHYPQLIYGVCLGRIPRSSLRLPREVMDLDDRISLAPLENSAKKCALKAFYPQALAVSGYGYANADSVYVGVKIPLATSRIGATRGRVARYELLAFSVDGILRLVRRPEGVIDKLKVLGVEALPGNLRLYGSVGTD